MATAPGRLSVLKTYKLYIDGAFPRSESGRSLEVCGAGGQTIAHLCKASRKDLRDSVEAARRGHEKWAAASSYNRGQVLYRIAEMMEGKSDELRNAIAAVNK
ncbi:MAG: aldehyde dehydrogenase family protein, partial [Planctomycetota bacterium]|nr:aldehyde dehydrogenase family protein [Planctomycetota bacterium]